MVATGRRSLSPPAKQRARLQGRPIGRQNPVIDIVIVATPFLALLFNLIIGPLTVLLVVATIGAFAVLRYERIWPLLATTWPLLLLPLFCLASVLWSHAPVATLRYGTLYLVTVIVALIIGGGTPRLSALKAIQIAFSVYLFASLLFGRWTVWQDGSYAFAGLAGSKNAAADVAGVGLLISTATLFWAVPRRKYFWAVCAVLTVLVALYSLVFAKSTGAILATIVALFCLFAWVLSRRFSTSVRVSIFLVAIMVVFAAALTATFWLDAFFEVIVQSSGKDATLTGRTDLWRVSDQYIYANPFVGIGYSAFWVAENLDAVKLWKMLGIPVGNPFNFHNTPRQIVVELGIVGFFLAASTWVYSSIKLLIMSMVSPDYHSLFLCSIITSVAIRLYFEVLGFGGMHIATVLMYSAFACGFASRAAGKARGERV